MRLHRTLAVGLAVACALVVLPADSPAGAASGDKFIVTLGHHSLEPHLYAKPVCEMDIQLRLQEFGKHGVQQFKYRSRIFSGWLSNYAPDAAGSLFRSPDWRYSGYFPNDERNFHMNWRNNPKFVMEASLYTVRIEGVGIRPSWWQPDLVSNLNPGSCDLGSASINYG